MACGDPELDMDVPSTRLTPTAEWKEYGRFETDPQRWCEKQFTRPQPPAGYTAAARAAPVASPPPPPPPPPAAAPSAAAAAAPAPAPALEVSKAETDDEEVIRQWIAQRPQGKLNELAALFKQVRAGDASKLEPILVSARQGDPDAQNFAGICLFNGFGTPEDPFGATTWFLLSAQQGNPAAKKNLENIRRLAENAGKANK
jgi:TPR repeat protein